VKLAVVLLILLALGTCWFFSGSGIIIGDGQVEGRMLRTASSTPGSSHRSQGQQHLMKGMKIVEGP
jgi:hypothetical protein